MKTKLLLTIAVLLLARFGGLSQTEKPQAPVKTGNEWKMPADVFRRAKAYSSGLQKKLQLDSVQTKKVYDLFLSNTKPLDEISVAAVSDKEKEVIRKSNEVAFNEKIKVILSVSQYQKFISLHK